MTVLHVDSVVAWGGGQEQVVALVRALAARGVRSVVAAPPGSLLHERLARIAAVSSVRIPLRGDVDPLGSYRLLLLVRRERVALLHAHSAHAHALCVPVARVCGVPLVVTRRNLSDPHARASLGGRVFTRWKYRAADRVLCVSPAVREDVRDVAGLTDATLRLAHTALTRAERPTDDACRAFRARHAGDAAPVLASLGALERVKGHDVLIDAVALLVESFPRLRVLIGGDGSQRSALAAYAALRGVTDRVVFLGHLEDPVPLLASCDVYVHPSRSEGAPGAVLEALAQERVVVASGVGGVEHILALEDGGTAGFLVPSEDARALAAAIVSALTDAARAQARRGSESVRTRFSIDAMADATLAAYRECVPSL